MKISVLIAAYQAAATLARALSSVELQDYADWEVIVVEDGSHDGSEQIVRDFVPAKGQLVRYENMGRNQGVAMTRNRLMQLAAGEAFAFLDADDEWAPDHLQTGVRHLQEGAGLVAMGVRAFDLQTGQTISQVIAPATLEKDPINTLFRESVIVTSSCVLITRELQQKTGEFDSTFRVGEDRDFWLRAALSGGTMKASHAITCHYAKHAGSTMGRTRLVAAQSVKFYEKYSSLTAVSPASRRQFLAHALSNEARLQRSSSPAASTRLLWRAWKLAPEKVALLPHLSLSAGRAIFKRSRQPFVLVADQLGGQCRYSGIHQLGRFIRDEENVRVIDTPDTRSRRLVGKGWSLLRRGPVRNQSIAFTEMQAELTLARSGIAALHFLVGENHDTYLSRPSGKTPLVATVHMPASICKRPPPKTGSVHTLVLLTGRERDFFAGGWGARQTVVIPHGVDTDFFHPGTGPTKPSVLIVGRFLRDFPLTAATVLLLANAHPDWRFDFVVPAAAWLGSDLAPVRELPNTHWHDRIDDETLRQLYQSATCQLSPFKDCTANNALVESLACGLPIVTTDIGGVRDYGAGSIYPLAQEHSAAALAVLCERYVADPEWRNKIAAACRNFALDQLSWPVIARRHLELYQQISSGISPLSS